mgnify:CR=1 FL=1
MYASSKMQASRPLSRHAQVRSQQRGISLELVDLLLDYGQERHVGHGATVLSFPKSARERLRQTLSRKVFASISSRLDVYAVVGDHGCIMTLGHRYQHLRGKH